MRQKDQDGMTICLPWYINPKTLDHYGNISIVAIQGLTVFKIVTLRGKSQVL